VDEAEKKRNRILNLVKIAVSLTGLAIVLLTQDIGEAVALLLQMAWLPFLIALLLSLSGVPVRAYRWGSLVWALGVRASWWRLVGLWFVGSFFNLFLPTGLGGDAVKMYELSRENRRTAAAISSVVVDRFLGLFVLFAMALLALAGGYERVTFQIRLLVSLVFVGCVVGVVLVLQRTWLEAWGRKLGLNRLLGRVRILDELWDSLHMYGTWPLLRATAASVVFNLTLILGVYFLGLAVGIDLSLWYYFLFVPIISVLLMVPSVGGLGVREGAYVFLFSQVVDREYAVALAFAYDLTLLASGLIGATIYLIQSVREARQ
jgi:uncharacterized protein (TIRG00374 family)